MREFGAYREHVTQLLHAALAAADPEAAVRRALRREGQALHAGSLTLPQTPNGRLFLIAVGKASVPMATAAAAVLGDALTAGIAITKRTKNEAAPSIPHTAITVTEGAHPVSDASSVAATTAVLDLLADTQPDDLVLCLISGGASALLTQPLLPLADWQAVNKALLVSGCTINEFNCVRRQLDRVKGGGLAAAAAPARCVSLILSDVVGNPLSDIGSGPTVPTSETAVDALTVLRRYQMEAALAPAVWERVAAALETAVSPRLPHPPHNEIIGDVRIAAEAAATAARTLGFQTQLLTAQLEGEAREVGRVVAAIAKDAPAGRCLILGGETTVTLRGDGIGGRNLETALAAALALDGVPETAVASIATDGDDGPTQAAGAVITGTTVKNGRDAHLDATAALAANDSYTYFNQLEPHLPAAHKTLLITGLTGTNVNDLIFILKY